MFEDSGIIFFYFYKKKAESFCQPPRLIVIKNHKFLVQASLSANCFSLAEASNSKTNFLVS